MFPLNPIQRKIPQHCEFEFIQPDDTVVTFSSEFDSGNCGLVEQISLTEYRVETHEDIDSTTNAGGYSKSWFYFKVQGLRGTVKFQIPRMKMLVKLAQEGCQTKLSFSFNFDSSSNTTSSSPSEGTYFAFSYPYSYARNLFFLESLENSASNNKDIYFNKEILTFTPHLRKIHLLTISSQDYKSSSLEPYLSDQLFPSREFENRAVKFKDNKPIILISARVHPGETPASFALEGFLKFLMNPHDLRALLLRKYFVFWVVPMLNPDGVFCGHYRMDIYNQNLNRFYQTATQNKQPSIFAMKQLIQYLSQEEKLLFYMDFHAHARKKGAFLYGNAIEEFSQQVESQLFAKLMALNDPTFEYSSCNFSKAQMKSKDRPEELTKEGCGRVFTYQTNKVIHSYTLECGFHHGIGSQNAQLQEYSNKDFTVEVKGKQYKLLEFPNTNTNTKKDLPGYFSINNFEQTGVAVLISILDAFEKNPYSRVGLMESIRKETANEFARSERMRIEDAQSYSKAKNIENLIYENFYQKIDAKGWFQLSENIEWPSCAKEQTVKKQTNKVIFSQSQSSLPLIHSYSQPLQLSQVNESESGRQQSPPPSQQQVLQLYSTKRSQKKIQRKMSLKLAQVSINESKGSYQDLQALDPIEYIKEKCVQESVYNFTIKKQERLSEKQNGQNIQQAPFIPTQQLIPKNRNLLQFFSQLKRPRGNGSMYSNQISLPLFDPLSVQAKGLETAKCKTESERRNSQGNAFIQMSDSKGQQESKHKQMNRTNRKIGSNGIQNCESLLDIAADKIPKLLKTQTFTIVEHVPTNTSNNPSLNNIIQTQYQPSNFSTNLHSHLLTTMTTPTIIGPNSALITNSQLGNSKLMMSSTSCGYKTTKTRLMYSNQNPTLLEKFDQKRISKMRGEEDKNWQLKGETSNKMQQPNMSESMSKIKVEQSKFQSQTSQQQFQDAGMHESEKMINSKDQEQQTQQQQQQQLKQQQQQQQLQVINNVCSTPQTNKNHYEKQASGSFYPLFQQMLRNSNKVKAPVSRKSCDTLNSDQLQLSFQPLSQRERRTDNIKDLLDPPIRKDTNSRTKSQEVSFNNNSKDGSNQIFPLNVNNSKDSINQNENQHENKEYSDFKQQSNNESPISRVQDQSPPKKVEQKSGKILRNKEGKQIKILRKQQTKQITNNSSSKGIIPNFFLEEEEVKQLIENQGTILYKPHLKSIKSTKKSQNTHLLLQNDEVQKLAALVNQQKKTKKEKQKIPPLIEEEQYSNKLEDKGSQSHSARDLIKKVYSTESEM